MGMPTSCEMTGGDLVGAGGQRLADAGEQLGPLLAGRGGPGREGGRGGLDRLVDVLGVPSGMVAMTSSVAESMTSSVPLPVEGTQAPLM
jgi:hypothetical protein